jgi:hypothetical protein
MPAAASAERLASAVCMSKNVSSAGAPPTADSISSADSVEPANASYVMEWPRSHSPSRIERRAARSAVHTSSTDRAADRSTPLEVSAPTIGCWCESTSPGTTVIPAPSTSSVRGPQHART